MNITIEATSGSPNPMQRLDSSCPLKPSESEVASFSQSHSTQSLTRRLPQRQAATKALNSFSAAYAPLIIPNDTDERDVLSNMDGVLATNDIVIDDMISDNNGERSDGESDAFIDESSLRGIRDKVNTKRKRPRKTTKGSVRKKAQRLDRDDLKLVARAAMDGAAGANQSKNGSFKALTREEAGRLMIFVEENIDWNVAAVRIYGQADEHQKSAAEDAGHQDCHQNSTAIHSENRLDTVSSRNLGGSKTARVSGGAVKDAEGLRRHWAETLSKRILKMYLS
ncbi:hypothetical protein MMC12_005291 [Toensbergia leucococca]|nr:hypothetical protein [Toensbergia leucococca]